MKAFDFSHWNMCSSKEGLLFFSQSLEEMLFHYGHDSLKIPALNFRFLCKEILETIAEIEKQTLLVGNIKPLFEELEDAFEKDPIVKSLYGVDFKELFYIKNSNGEYTKNWNDVKKELENRNSIKRIAKVIKYLDNDMENGEKYFLKLKEEIGTQIRNPNFVYENSKKLYQLSRTLLTELVNRSYSQEYIYFVINDIFYNTQKRGIEVSATLEFFWMQFSFKEKDYKVTELYRYARFAPLFRGVFLIISFKIIHCVCQALDY